MGDQANDDISEAGILEETAVRREDHRCQSEVNESEVENRHVVEQDSPQSAEHALSHFRVPLIECRAERTSRLERYDLAP